MDVFKTDIEEQITPIYIDIVYGLYASCFRFSNIWTFYHLPTNFEIIQEIIQKILTIYMCKKYISLVNNAFVVFLSLVDAIALYVFVALERSSVLDLYYIG
jgi:hypothetical protein